ncbi:MAG TPA: preprotein translocase subunit YajC [Bryobacteraceae bacterium]|jgi:preprotein translocase subunit YajC
MTLLLSMLLQANSPAPSALLQFAPIIVIFGIFYLLLFLPMQKQKKAQAKMLTELKNGDSVITTGGIIGTITGVDGDTLTLRIKPDNLKLQFARSAVSALVNTDTSDGTKQATRDSSK